MNRYVNSIPADWPRRANHAIFGPSAFHRAAMASQAAYCSVQRARTTLLRKDQAPKHACPMRTPRMRSGRSWAASRRQQRLRGGARKSMLRCLSTRSATAHAHSTQPADDLQRSTVLPALPLAAELVQPPPAANLPNAGIVRGGEHGIFVRGYEDRPSMKGCSLGMILRCVRATRASARDIRSTLPARRDDRSRFTRSVGRMYLLTSNALRV